MTPIANFFERREFPFARYTCLGCGCFYSNPNGHVARNKALEHVKECGKVRALLLQ